jgi:hypothetical protein
MNTKGLAKLYDRLTPRERLPLIVAASAREDEIELERLARSAPTVAFRAPDYFGLAEAVQMLGLFHVLQVLDLATLFWHASGAAADRRGLFDEEDDAVQERLWGCTRMFGYLITVKAEGWQRYCVEMQLDGDLLLKHLPAHRAVSLTEEAARGVAFTREEATAWLRRAEDGAEAPTAETVAASMREFVDWRAAWWG